MKESGLLVKKDKYTILIIILSVLLVISLIVGSTFAWFMSSDSASQSIVLGDPVEMIIVDENNADSEDLPMIIPGNRLVPGMQITVLAKVLFTQSNTPALLRAKIGTRITGSTADVGDIAILETQLEAAMGSAVATSGTQKWVYNSSDDWWYYLGNELIEGNVEQSIMKRIDATGETVNERLVTFFSSSFIFPYVVGNEFANSDVEFSVEFQAIQGYLPAYTDELLIGENETDPTLAGFRKNRIANVVDVFNEAFAG